MKAVTKFLAGGVAIAALASAAPAAAQYYPVTVSRTATVTGYGGGNVVGQVINQVLGGGYGYNGYGYSAATARPRSASASARSRQRLSGGYGSYGGYGYSGYGYNG